MTWDTYTVDEQFREDFWRFNSFIDSKADDRTIAIVSASYAEKYLGELLKLRLPGLNHDLRTKIFHPSHGVLGPFAARIDLAKALNLVDGDVFHNLKLVASIRNKFAHEIAITSFDDPSVATRVDNLRGPFIITETEAEQREWKEKWAVMGRREKFEWAAKNLTMAIYNTLNLHYETVIKPRLEN